MTALTVLVFALIGLRLVALVLQMLVSRSPQPRVPPPDGPQDADPAIQAASPEFDPCLGPYGLRGSPPSSPEGQLALRLTSGAIDRPRYQQEMAGLAAADARAHPLAVPPDWPGA